MKFEINKMLNSELEDAYKEFCKQQETSDAELRNVLDEDNKRVKDELEKQEHDAEK